MKVSGLGKFSLGQAVPNKDHAVCVSLPTVKDLIGYEEKKPETINSLKSGYPRFVQHRFIKDLIEVENKTKDLGQNNSSIFANIENCQRAIDHFSLVDYQITEEDRYSILHTSTFQEANSVKSFLQHTGSSISSRLAEDILIEKGILYTRENVSPHENPDLFARNKIAEVHGEGVSPENVIISSSGANAFYSLFYNTHKFFAKKKRKIWIQLGWLYLDTIETIKLFCKEDEIIFIKKPFDLKAISYNFEKFGDQIAGVVTEFPTNPLLQSCDLEQIKELCDRTGSILIVDPTMASPKNSKVVKFADIIVNSLTKYASWEGDLMIGSLVFPAHSEIGKALFNDIKNMVSRPFKADLNRLCEQLPFYSNFVKKTNQSLLQVVEFLISSDLVKKVFWSYQECSKEFFRLRAGDDNPGCVTSFEIKGSFEKFYNRLQMLKSPSFGTEFSLCCPYVYLAHYNLMKSKSGKALLKEAGISPNLCRLSVGLENPQDVIDTLKEALVYAVK